MTGRRVRTDERGSLLEQRRLRRLPMFGIGNGDQWDALAQKILWWHEAFGHDPQSFSLPTMIPHEQRLDMLERFASEVVPVVGKAAPTTLWTDGDPYGGRPAVHGRTAVDAASGR
ncbi:hypothetical protein AB0F52_09950 [Amycolatopsis sp. NPDC024027]|uniref:hypothetical protein n=1 Tax=Amycolatopsis sp. NPDC024027 TaxID=3154327 RepID=UPI0033E3F9FF